mgnify:CR=1 FL=1
MSIDFLNKLKNKKIFLFGTAGYGESEKYFEGIINNVKKNIDSSNTIIGTFMCQGKMPLSVRERYEKMREQNNISLNIDKLIANFDKALSHPNTDDLKTLEQRNNYLRQIKELNKPENMLEIWDEKLAEYAEIICRYRIEFIEKLNNKIKKIHSEVTENKEKLEIKYITECENKENYLSLLKQRRKLDIIKGYTTKGIHRDDFKIFINERELGIYGSQGQHRTSILSLKMAELDIIKKLKYMVHKGNIELQFFL